MKYAVVIYHKKAGNYPAEWIERCLQSLEDQTDQDFTVFELNYGVDVNSILRGRFPGKKMFCAKPCSNHAEAMNHIYSEAFKWCDVVFNVNIDDYYSAFRIQQQKYWLEEYDIVSSNYMKVIDGVEGQVVDLAGKGLHMLQANLNVVSNPAHAMHKRVFEKQKFDGNLIPYEDLEYWKLAVKNGFKIKIIPMNLHFYRIHGSQIGKTI